MPQTKLFSEYFRLLYLFLVAPESFHHPHLLVLVPAVRDHPPSWGSVQPELSIKIFSHVLV